MEKWTRIAHQPCLPMGKDGRLVTACEEHIRLSRTAATEGMVLLKNEGGVLPLKRGSKAAVFGKGQIDYVRGGGGSGEVTTSYTRNIYEGLKIKEAEGKLQIFDALSHFYEENVKQQYARGKENGKTVEPAVPEELLQAARRFTDTAVITICRFSGEGWDRKGIPGDGDFYLSPQEQAMVDAVTAAFPRVAVVLDVGGMVDSAWFKDNDRIQSVLLAWQAGIEGGLAVADILCGDVNPSGKLVDTFAGSFDDYPSSANFNESEDYVEYTEDIYVGYRYFETIPGAAEKVNYPFGYGLSYTSFAIEGVSARLQEMNGVAQIAAQASVTNTGSIAGKEVVQLYYSAPQGKLGKPAKVLGAFAKTRCLQPGETQKVTLNLTVDSMASYDDTGKVAKSAYVMEAGEYAFHLGNSVRNTVELSYRYVEKEDRVTMQLQERVAPVLLKERMLSDGSYEALPVQPDYGIDMSPDFMEGKPPYKGNWADDAVAQAVGEGTPAEKAMLIDVVNGKVTMEQFLAQLTNGQLIDLLCGQPNTGVANTFGMGNLPEYGVPNLMTADGPAGVRIRPSMGVCTTAWPCATLLACSWNPDIVYEVGAAGAREMKENNLGVWLTPAMNIHRSPLCGRNFEYYSEDPLIAGKMAAAKVNGIQSEHIGASVKHFACNNKETNRKASDSRVSERALREIYLKGFEIAVKEAQPWTLMTCYNLINGRYASEREDLLAGILREEWGFEGMVTTDWWNKAYQYKEIKAGNDLKMGSGDPDEVLAALKEGKVTRAEIETCAARILETIMKLD
ncbi:MULTISPECIES: glycoside hydrolase family 3 protein [Eisenbergiella]|uniref:Beta-glucosidase n=1 Tax=Eisenbergiella porci TaxID=2652274 RepID=A0A6N7VW25_9FIRM|nr:MULTISPECIES: glycoside hydrolase family 3 protein [Eisenbergiella]MDY2655342.1 glycoside hydrolase family 3 C-terminal domain-containing protein [Eisenbergiella porci]MSS87236.1 beta-glucosidase [Eisenbergiella porci]